MPSLTCAAIEELLIAVRYTKRTAVVQRFPYCGLFSQLLGLSCRLCAALHHTGHHRDEKDEHGKRG